MPNDLSPNSELALAATLELCRQLQRTVRAITLYGGDHPTTKPAVAGLGVRCGEVQAAVHLAFAPDQLIVDDREVALDPLLTTLTNHLHALGVARMTVYAGAEEDEVAALAHYLARRPEEKVDPPHLPHFPMERLAYVAAATSRSTVAASVGEVHERQRQLWRALATGHLGAHEALDSEAQAFVKEMMRHKGSLQELIRALPIDDADPAAIDTPRLPGKMVARLLHHLEEAGAGATDRDGLAANIAARLMELKPDTVADALADEAAPQALIARGLAQQPNHDLLEMMAAVVRAEGADSTRLSHCIGAFLSPEARASGLLPQVCQRLHSAAEAGDGELLAVWQRVEEIALEQSGERYMSAAYEEQLDDFAAAHFPNLSKYQDDGRLDAARLATLEPDALAADHTQLLLDLLANESNPNAFREVVEALGRRLTQAVEAQDFTLATLISADLKRHCEPDSPRPKDVKQTIRQQLNAIGVVEMVDRALGEVRTVEAAWSETFHTFLSLFERAIAPHLLDRLRDEEDRRVRRTIMQTLARFAGDLVPELTRRLDGAPWFYARNLVHLLGDAASEEAVRPLTLALGHADARVAKEAILALREIDSPRALPFMIKLLTVGRGGATADYDRVCIEAARYLARNRSPTSVEALRKGILSPRPAVAKACRRLLHDQPGGDP